ncbi:15190_t:CDS:2, partial [Racocetra persica]
KSDNYEDFMNQNDKWWDNDENDTIMTMTYLTVRSKDELNKKMNKLQPLKTSKFRLSKPDYFMYLAELIASRTNCMSRKVGCVLVKDDYRVIATGYNGTPKDPPSDPSLHENSEFLLIVKTKSRIIPCPIHSKVRNNFPNMIEKLTQIVDPILKKEEYFDRSNYCFFFQPFDRWCHANPYLYVLFGLLQYNQ